MTSGSEPGTGISRALSSGTRSKPMWRAAVAGNAASRSSVTVKMHDTTSEATQRSIAAYIPLGRAGEPEDAQGAVTFLASRAGAYVNGHVIPLDGGYIAAL